MFKKLKAAWHAVVAIVVTCIIIALLTVAVPIFLGLLAVTVIGFIGYVVYQINNAD